MNSEEHAPVSTSPSLPLSSSPLPPVSPSPLPEMTRNEGSFHASVAGARAAAEAQQSGGDPAHAAALGLAAIGGIVLHGLPLAPPSAYAALAVPAISEVMERHHTGGMIALQSDGLFIAAFHKPRDVYRLACVQADAESAKALLALANDIVLTLETREAIDAVVAWCQDAFARLNGVKKPSPAGLNPSPAPMASPSAETSSSSASPANPSEAAPAGSSPSSMP